MSADVLKGFSLQAEAITVATCLMHPDSEAALSAQIHHYWYMMRRVELAGGQDAHQRCCVWPMQKIGYWYLCANKVNCASSHARIRAHAELRLGVWFLVSCSLL